MELEDTFQRVTQRNVASATRDFGVPKKRPKINPEDRVCEAPDCTTKISIYNSQPKCYRHQVGKFPRVRGHAPRERTA